MSKWPFPNHRNFLISYCLRRILNNRSILVDTFLCSLWSIHVIFGWLGDKVSLGFQNDLERFPRGSGMLCKLEGKAWDLAPSNTGTVCIQHDLMECEQAGVRKSSTTVTLDKQLQSSGILSLPLKNVDKDAGPEFRSLYQMPLIHHFRICLFFWPLVRWPVLLAPKSFPLVQPEHMISCLYLRPQRVSTGKVWEATGTH